MEKEEIKTNDKPILHPLTDQSKKSTLDSSFSFKKGVLIFIVAIILGVVSGFGGGSLASREPPQTTKTTENKEFQTVQKRAGVVDKETFRDTAEGILKEGGIDGEGHFHLERPGGSSQNVYLTSITVDLSKYLDKKVRVWGETYSAEKAGWLMDVGFIEVIE